MVYDKVTVREILSNPESYADRAAEVSGWVRSNRDSKALGFLSVSDGSAFEPIQVVYTDALEGYADIARIAVGSSVTARGKLTLTPEAKQPFELQADSVTLLGTATDYPLQKKRHSMEFLRTMPHLRPRTNTFQAVFRISSVISHAIHEFFYSRGFVYVHTPLITASDCEGAGEMFQVTTLPLDAVPKTADGAVDYAEDFFGQQANLTVSGQLDVESFAHAFNGVYTFGPTFRAEDSNTPRHAAEFWMIEPEVAFCDLEGDMELAEALLKYVLRAVMDEAASELEFLNSFVDRDLLERLHHVESSSFGRVTYTEAVEILMSHNADFAYPVSWGVDLQTEHERYLTEQVYRKPIFVTDYPRDIKAFYMRANDDGRTVAAMDCLVPGVGEIIGGSQREERLDRLQARIRELHMNEAAYEHYLDLRRFGTCETSGFGLGFERLLMYVTGISNIRDVVPYPRTTGSIA